MSAAERYERLQVVLAERATGGLSEAESAEIDALLREFPDVWEDDWDLVAARTELELAGLADAASTGAPPGLDPSLRDKILRDAAARIRPPKRRARLAALPWLAAAAAVIAALYFATAPPRDGLDPAVARATLVAEAEDLLTLSWQSNDDPAARAGVEGDLIWSASAQRGFMRFRGLAANDPSVEQYQLWIFDQTRPEATPVDGGVFDIENGDDFSVVAIDAKLRVGAPHLFAVTVEAPGGVVVSGRSRIAALASVDE